MYNGYRDVAALILFTGAVTMVWELCSWVKGKIRGRG